MKTKYGKLKTLLKKKFFNNGLNKNFFLTHVKAPRTIIQWENRQLEETWVPVLSLDLGVNIQNIINSVQVLIKKEKMAKRLIKNPAKKKILVITID